MEKDNFDVTLYASDLDTNPKYSLDVDPLNKYNLSETQKEFISLYSEYKNLAIVARLLNIDDSTAITYFNSYATREELKRLNRARYQRIFLTKMLKMEEIGAYLTSLITEDGLVGEDKNIKISDKIKASQMLIDINKYKDEVLKVPDEILGRDMNEIESRIKSLPLTDIKSLLEEEKEKEEKREIIKEIKNKCKLNDEDVKLLETLSLSDLKKMNE